MAVDADVAAFRAARDLLLAHREDYATAYREFHWPAPRKFNWARDWFDGVLAVEHANAPALWIVEEDGGEVKLTFAELSERSSQVAGWLRALGVRRGDRLLLMLGNQVELWETVLAAMKLGAVIIPASTLLGPDDLVDRVTRGSVGHVVARAADTPKFAPVPGGFTRIAVGTAGAQPEPVSGVGEHPPIGTAGAQPEPVSGVGEHPPISTAGAQPEPVSGVGEHPPIGTGAPAGWLDYADAYASLEDSSEDGPTDPTDPLMLYFTSGTTASPKLVEHTHVSYPVGHLSTMYWIGLRPGDIHLNISSPGWAKHAWSNIFAPWNAAACVLIVNYQRFSAKFLLDSATRCGASTLCAPPTVWRMLIQADLSAWTVPFRECVAAGEPLNPEVIERVRDAWGITVRDGYGQTETTAQIGNPPGQELRPGSMGRPLPGYDVTLADPVTGARGDEGELCLDLAHRPLGLMVGYRDSIERNDEAMRGGLYHTGDVAGRDADGYITYVGRTDDVFKASDYRISPFELESVLLEHEAVAEAAVVPAPDALRLAVPKAYVVLAAGWAPDAGTAEAILRFARERLAPYKRVRRVEFADLPKTISGKIRRVELREAENARQGERAAAEFREEDFPNLKA